MTLNEATAPQEIACVLVKYQGDLWMLERATHDGREWDERIEHGTAFRRSCRLDGARATSIEGSAAEWSAIAEAIERSDSRSFSRCSAERTANGYEFCSPRNSAVPVLLTFASASRVAIVIREALKNPTEVA